MSAAKERPRETGKLSLVEQLITIFSRDEGDVGLVQLFYNFLTHSTGISLDKLEVASQSDSQEDSLSKSRLERLAAKVAGEKILEALLVRELEKQEKVDLVDSIFPAIESALVMTGHILNDRQLADQAFLLRPHASKNTQNLSGRQNALSQLPKQVQKAIEVSLWAYIDERNVDSSQIAHVLDLIKNVLNLMSDHHFSDASSFFRQFFELISTIQDPRVSAGLSPSDKAVLLDEAIRFSEHVEALVPDGQELDLLQQLAALLTAKKQLLPQDVFEVLIKALPKKVVPPPGIEPGFSA